MSHRIEAVMHGLEAAGYRVDCHAYQRIASGLESEIYAMVVNGEKHVVKLPIVTVASNANDAHLDYREIYRQEWEILQVLSQSVSSVPCPRPVYLGSGGQFPFLVMAFLDNDDGPVAEDDALSVLHRLHTIRYPADTTLAHASHHWVGDCLASRIVSRLTRLHAWAEVGYTWATEDLLREWMHEDRNGHALLHMDFRRANILTRQRRIVGLIDWSNALIGSPLIELARIAVYGEFSEDFVARYLAVTPAVRYYRRPYQIYRLDSIVMLCLVFCSEAPNETMAQRMLGTLRALERELREP